jgi:RNA polymerase sigma factor (sigma-70 family)
MSSLTAQQRQDLIDELPRLKRFCLSLTSDPSDADDLLQVTVERLLEKGMPADAHVAKWSHRVCRNLWIDEIRSRDVRNRYAQSEGAIEGAGTTAENSDESVQLDRVSAAMERLPPEQRAALVQVAVEGCSYAEAAAILEVPIGTIMSRVARARKALTEDLEWKTEREA